MKIKGKEKRKRTNQLEKRKAKIYISCLQMQKHWDL